MILKTKPIEAKEEEEKRTNKLLYAEYQERNKVIHKEEELPIDERDRLLDESYDMYLDSEMSITEDVEIPKAEMPQAEHPQAEHPKAEMPQLSQDEIIGLSDIPNKKKLLKLIKSTKKKLRAEALASGEDIKTDEYRADENQLVGIVLKKLGYVQELTGGRGGIVHLSPRSGTGGDSGRSSKQEKEDVRRSIQGLQEQVTKLSKTARVNSELSQKLEVKEYEENSKIVSDKEEIYDAFDTEFESSWARYVLDGPTGTEWMTLYGKDTVFEMMGVMLKEVDKNLDDGASVEPDDIAKFIDFKVKILLDEVASQGANKTIGEEV